MSLDTYIFVSRKAWQVVDPALIEQFKNCSFKSGGYLFKTFKKYKEEKTSKIVYCLYFRKVVGWGLRYRNTGRKTTYGIMLYVKKDFRRKGIGSEIYKKLALGLKRSTIEYWPHDRKSHDFFKKVA